MKGLQGWHIVSFADMAERGLTCDVAWAAFSQLTRFGTADVMAITVQGPDGQYAILTEKVDAQ